MADESVCRCALCEGALNDDHRTKLGHKGRETITRIATERGDNDLCDRLNEDPCFIHECCH